MDNIADTFLTVGLAIEAGLQQPIWPNRNSHQGAICMRVVP